MKLLAILAAALLAGTATAQPSSGAHQDVLVVTGRVEAAPGKADALRRALIDVIKPTRTDPGNLAYDLYEARDHPGRFLLIERWRSEAALARHKAGADYRAFFAHAQREHLLAEAAEEVHWRKVER